MTSPFVDKLLDGKTAFVAGASSGINLAIARLLVQHGARVGMISRRAEKIGAAAQSIIDAGGQALGMAADVRDYDAVAAALARTRATFGTLDVVVSGAAGNFIAPVVGMSANAFRTVIDIDLIGTFNVFRAAFEHVAPDGASMLALTAPQAVRPRPFQAHACAAKAGINMLIQCLAMEWGAARVRVNGISPGPIEGTEGVARLAPSPEHERRAKERLALRSYGSTDDIAQLALFLCSDAARYVTGSIFDCDGGSKLGDASGDALHPLPRV